MIATAAAFALVIAAGVILVGRLSHSNDEDVATSASPSPPLTTPPSSRSVSEPAPVRPESSHLDASELVDRTWVILADPATNTAPGLIAWFELRAEGATTGSDGCGSFDGPAGTWTFAGGTLTVGPLNNAESTCGDGADPPSPFDTGVATVVKTEDGALTIASTNATWTAESLDDHSLADPVSLLGRWTDGFNHFQFQRDGVVRFTRVQSCDGSYVLDSGRLAISFEDCTAAAVQLPAPIFRNATAYTPSGADVLVLRGDAGVAALVAEH